MLILLSDLHFTDQSTADNVHQSAFENVLGPEITTAAKQKKAVEIQIALLGDILDLVRTDWWFKNAANPGERPWDGELDRDTGMNQDKSKIARQFERVLDGILASPSATTFVNMLNDLPNKTGLKTRVTYVIGNHDRAFHNFSSLCNKVKSKLPNVDLQFQSVLFASEYGVLARHGHEWDENCHGWEFANKVLNKNRRLNRFDQESYRVQAIGEVITAELMSGIVYRIEQVIDKTLQEDIEFLKNLRNVNNLRPMLEVFTWLNWFTRNQAAKYKDIIRSALLGSLTGLLESRLAKQWDEIEPDFIVSGDITDRLELVRRALSKRNFDDFRRDVTAIASLQKIFSIFGQSKDECTEGARKEWEIEPKSQMGDIQYIVYGHTHEARQCCFSGSPDGKVKMYINTGTFLPLIERTHDEKGFSTAHRMTIASFFKSDEDAEGREGGGPTVDLWNGIRRKVYA